MKKRTKWTKELIVKEAKKYKTRAEFEKGSPAYQAALRMKIMDDVCKHMDPFYKSWDTDAKIKKEAAKYQTRTAFMKGSKGAYVAAQRRNIIDDVTSHMEILGSRKLRFVYAYLFHETKQVYVGLSYSLNARHNYHNHPDNTSVLGVLLNTPSTDYEYIHTTFPLPVEHAKKREGEWLEYYEKAGFIKLNIIKTGGVGGSQLIWTREAITKEAAQYKTRNKFKVGSKGAYDAARKLGILDTVCSHMAAVYPPLDSASIANKAAQYKTRNAFRIGSRREYTAARKLGILDTVCSHMVIQRRRWNKVSLSAEAAKYETRGAFAKSSGSAYMAAFRLGILDDICSDMEIVLNRWDYASILKEALEYLTRSAFKKECYCAYRAALRRGILDEVCQHMKKVN